MTITTIRAHAIRTPGKENYALEQDDGSMGLGPLCARTLFFGGDDEEALLSHMSAAPGGHEAVEKVPVVLTIEVGQ